MPRGSKPGTKRGGRKRGTPNRRTILADRIFVAAAAHPVAGWQELHSVLMDDQALPADTRLAIAQKSRSAAARSHKARAKTSNAKLAATLGQKQAAVELDSLLRLARDASLTEEERRKAAGRMARVLLPATPTGDPSWSRAVADEYGFVISPKIASEYRDAKLLLQKLEDGNGSIRPGNVRQADKLQARLAAIRRSLEPPPLPPLKPPTHLLYGMYVAHRIEPAGQEPSQPVGQDQFQHDQVRLFYLERKRRSKIGLTEEEVAEEAHRMARVDTLIYGADSEARKRWAHRERQARRAKENGRRLKPRAKTDLRLLRVLYGMPSTFAEDPERAADYLLRDAKPANDGNLYPYNSKLRPPPLWIDEDGVEIADLPKVFYDDPHYWPYTAVDPYHVRYVAQQRCLVCGGGSANAHRLRFTEELVRKASDEFTVPLCRDHYDELQAAKDEAAWWRRIGVNPIDSARMLWRVTHPKITAEQLRRPAEGRLLRSQRLALYAALEANQAASMPPQPPTDNPAGAPAAR
jgi:transcriptional regulator with XRE-family HTH domain